MTEKSLSGKWEDDIALFTTRLKEQLAASQAREQKMREALESIANTPHMHQDRYTESALKTALKALALTHDTSALDAITKDAERLNFIASEYIKIDPFSIPTGGDDADVGWCLSQYYMAKPNEREIHRHYNDDLRSAIDSAMKLGAGETAPDLNTCPNCGGEADQGHDRCYPPTAYLCSKCQSTTEDCSVVQTNKG